MTVTAYDLAQRFVGVTETHGATSTPMILAMLKLDNAWPTDDAVPWCSAFVNFIAWLLRLPRSKSLAARSWLDVGRPIDLADGVLGNDVVILSRSQCAAGGGHVGFFARYDASTQLVYLLGGNQGDSVSLASFPVDRVLGVRRLA